MHIEKFTVCGRSYLRLVRSKRRLTRNGKPISGKELVLGLGPLSRHDDGKPDYLQRLRASFRAGKPLIKELEPFVGEAPKERILVPFEPGDAKCLGKPRRLAATILDPVFRALGLDELFASIKFSSRIGYDLTGIVRLLTYGRILEPASKSATMEQNGKYFRPLVSSTNDDNVYDALDVIQRHAKQIVQRMNTCVTRGTGRSSKVVFYDVTNFFFETPRPDPDTTDADGNVVEKGLRKMGVSKENRRQPIVQLGLFLDDNGIPISFGMFPGNTLDHHTLGPAMEKTVDSLGLKRFVLVADRGMYSGTNMCHVTDAGNGYIVAKSLRKSTRKEVEWAISPLGYDSPDADFRCKSRTVERTVKLVEKDKDGKDVTVTRKFKEKVVVYWSKAFYERELHENASFLSFDEKLSAFNELFGYYQIVTSELDMPEREVIDKYHGLTQIEDQFREMKSTLETRPVYVRTREHIEAHLMVCFIALTMMRLIQRKTKASLGAEFGKDLDWTYGIPGARLASALREWQVTELPGDYYQMLNASDGDIVTLFKAFGIDVPAKIYTKGDLLELKSAIDPF